MASLSIDADWDPMRLDFEDPNFNKFISGPGETLSYDPKAPQEFKLQVTDIPAHCTRQSLMNIFSKFGAMEIRAFIQDKESHTRAVAYIVYNNQISANRAIKEVHEEEPFRLKVTYARPKRDKKSKDFFLDHRCAEIKKNNEKAAKERDSQAPPDNIFYGPKFDDIRSKLFPPKLTYNFISDDNFDSTYCNPLVDFNSVENKIYPAVDEIFSKMYESNHRRVTMGRGYRPKTHEAKVAREESRRMESRRKAVNGTSGICELCSKKSFKNCNFCRAFYCSRECQVQDWPQHKLVCSSSSGIKSETDNEANEPVVALKVTHVQNDHIYAIRMDDVSRFEELRHRLLSESPKQPGLRPAKGARCAVFDDSRNEWCRGVFVQVSAPLHTIFFLDYGYSKPCMASSIKLLHHELAKDEPFAIKINLNDMKIDSMSVGCIIKVILLEKENDSHKAVLKEVGKSVPKSVCSTAMRSEFFGKTNVKIIELSTEEFTEVSILGVLTKSTYFASWNQLITPDKTEVVNAYIKTDEDSIYPAGTKLRVRSTCRLSSDFFSVEIESSPELPQEKPVFPVSLIKLLREGDGGQIHVTSVQRHSSFLAFLVVKTSSIASFFRKWGVKLFKTLQEEMSANDDQNFLPNVGDLVAVFSEREALWMRGVVWSVSGSALARIALIDYGRVLSASLKHVKPLDKKFIDVPSLAVYCNVEMFESKNDYENLLKNSEEVFDFTVEKSQNEAVVCSVLNKGAVICSMEISEWNPTAEEIGLKAVALKNNAEVKLSQFYSTSIMYVISVSQANFMIEQKLDKHVRSSLPMKRIPRFGELVACKWSKNNEYFRAQVLEPFGQSEYRIFFVDSGTQEIGKLEDIIELNDELKSYPGLANKILLKGIEDEIVNAETINYLNGNGFKDEALKIVTNSEDLSSVELKHLNNVSVNERLNHFLQTNNAVSQGESTFEDVHFQDWSIGTDVELSLLCTVESYFLMIEAKSNAAQYYFNVLQEKINDYCESLSTKGLYPRVGNIVFVQIDTRDVANKNWYRAVVNENPRLGSSVVRCLDIGGVGDILHTSIRKMHPKFMVVPAIANYVDLQFPKNLCSSESRNVEGMSLTPFETYLCSITAKEDFIHCAKLKDLSRRSSS